MHHFFVVLTYTFYVFLVIIFNNFILVFCQEYVTECDMLYDIFFSTMQIK